MTSPSRTLWQRWNLVFIGLVVTVVVVLLAFALEGPFAAGFVGCLTVVPAIVAFVATFWVMATRRALMEGNPPQPGSVTDSK